MYRIMLADDEGIVIDSLKFIIEKNFPGECEIQSAKTGRSVIELAETFRPDIAFMDIRMPGIDGFGVLAKLKEIHPDIRVLLMAGMPLKEEENRAREEGAKGYLPKNVDQDRLVAAIRSIAAGETEFVCEEFQAAPSTLTARELDVLREVASGKQRDAIAATLGIGPESVKTHLKGIMSKLNCPNATSAVSRAYELGILRA